MSAENETWFVARTRWCQELKVRECLSESGVECFIPTRETFRERQGRKVRTEVPVIRNLVFLKTTKSMALALVNGRGLPMSYIIDRSTRTLLEVPPKQMDDFMRVMNLDPDALCEDSDSIVPGSRVRVTKGDLAGVEGEVMSLPTRTYVVVSVMSLLFAKVQIPKAYLELLK